jgi:hypothetical protein
VLTNADVSVRNAMFAVVSAVVAAVAVDRAEHAAGMVQVNFGNS